jgi:hypothetical protein
VNTLQEDGWHYTLNGERFGPVSLSDLHLAVAESKLNPRLDMVWRQGMEDWKPSGEIDGLFQKRIAVNVGNVFAASSGFDPQASPDTDSGSLCSREHLSEKQRSPLIQGIMVFSLPLALLIASAGWAAFWLLYDFLWSLVSVKDVHVPWVVLVFVFCGGGYLMGKPLGLWARKTGFISRSGWRYVCLMLMVAAAAVLGELIYAGCSLTIAGQPVGPGELIGFLVQPFLVADFTEILMAAAQLLLRSLLAIGALVGAVSVMSPEELENAHVDPAS